MEFHVEKSRQRLAVRDPSLLQLFWRDNTGQEIDLLFEVGGKLQAIEAKSGATFTSDWLRGMKRWRKLAGAQAEQPLLIHGGEQEYEHDGVKALPWGSVGDLLPR